MGNGTRSAPGAAASPARATSTSSYPLLKAGVPPTEGPHSRATPSRRKSLFIQSSEEPFGSQLTLFQQNRPTFPPHLLSSSPEASSSPPGCRLRVDSSPGVPASRDPAGRRKRPDRKCDFLGKWELTSQAVTPRSPSRSPGVPQPQRHSVSLVQLFSGRCTATAPEPTLLQPLERPRPKNK